MKEHFVKEYLSSINFKTKNWSVEEIKESLKKGLGEYPAIDVIYKKDVVINESTNEAVEVHEVSKISVVFTNENDQFRKIEIIL
jgi:hypothetical protein